VTEPTRAAVYVRVSTAEQARDDSSSLDDQEARCRAYAASQGWAVAEVYRDAGASGAKGLGDRPAGAALLADAKAGSFSRVIFHKVDRFTRHAGKGRTDFETLDDLGVGLVFVVEQTDTSTPSGRLFQTLLMAFAEFERERIAERTAQGRRGALEAQRWASGPPPYGYRTVSGSLVADDEAGEHSPAKVVGLVFRWLAAGSGLKAVCRRLEDLGVPTPSGGKVWSHQTISRMLDRADTYAGKGAPFTAEGVEYILPAPALVAPKVAAEAVKVAASRSSTRTVANTDRPWPLGGRVFHVHPDGEHHRMLGRFDARRGGVRYYRCVAATDPTGPGCPGLGEGRGNSFTAVRSAEVEAAAILVGLSLLDSPEDLRTYAANYRAERLGVEEGEGELEVLERSPLKPRQPTGPEPVRCQCLIDESPRRCMPLEALGERNRVAQEPVDGIHDRTVRISPPRRRAVVL
jgi:site-specific DNA recombinase